MRRPTPIRITKNDIEEYKRLVKNTKAKISRTNKKYGIDLSDEISLPNIDNFKTRKDFNEWKDKTTSFNNRANTNYQFKKNEFGVVASKKEINATLKATKRAQKVFDKLAKESADRPFMVGGKKQGTVGEQYSQLKKPVVGGVTRPPDFDFDNIKTRSYFNEKKENMEERSDPKFLDKRAIQLQQNYIKAIEKSFNSNGDELIKKVADIPADVFYEMFLSNSEIQVWYPYTESEREGVLSKIDSVLNTYFEGTMNMDMKGF